MFVKYPGSKLSDIFAKIDKLLSGRLVVSGGKSVSTSQHPNSITARTLSVTNWPRSLVSSHDLEFELVETQDYWSVLSLYNPMCLPYSA